jgi:NitT/TauT family transport system substrate-binding protein
VETFYQLIIKYKELVNLKKICVILTLILSLSSMIFVGCGNEKTSETKNNKSEAKAKNSQEKDTSSSNSEKKELEKVIVVQPAVSELWSAAYIAQVLGYYEDEGLDVEFTTVSGAAAPSALLGDKADIGLFGYEMVLMFNEKGKDVKMINATTGKFPYSIVAQSDIKDMKDLKGKTISADPVGSSGRAFVRTCVKKAGLEPGKDVTLTEVKGNGSIVAAMESNQVQATYAYGIRKQELLKRGCNLILDIADPDTHKEIIGSPTYEMFITCTTGKVIKEKPEMLQKFENAMYRASLWQQEHSAKEIAEKLSEYFPERDINNLVASLTEMKEYLSKEGELTLTGHEAANKIALSAGMIKEPVSREDAVNDSFFKKAKEKYGK